MPTVEAHLRAEDRGMPSEQLIRFRVIVSLCLTLVSADRAGFFFLVQIALLKPLHLRLA
jgi:hypothetical protein